MTERIASEAFVYENDRLATHETITAGQDLSVLVGRLLRGRGDGASVVLTDGAGHRLEVWRLERGQVALAWRLGRIHVRSPTVS